MRASIRQQTADALDVRSLQPGEEPLVGEVIADSHADYPSFVYLFGDVDRRRQVLGRLMTAVARDARSNGVVTVAVEDDRMLGVAIWLAPGHYPWSARRKLRAALAFTSLSWPARGSLRPFFASGTNAEKAAPTEPHWNLQAMGVRRSAQGRGLGTRLLQPVLQHADQERIACYLETADQSNLAFYNRLGFQFDQRHHLIPDGPPHFSMRRPPSPLRTQEGAS